MEIENILRTTCNEVRARFPFKGMNKFYPNKKLISKEKLLHAYYITHDRVRIVQARRYDRARDDNLVDYIDERIAWVNSNGIICANCNIYSSFAYNSLVSKHFEINRAFGYGVNIFRIDAAKPADHQFVLVGEPLPDNPLNGIIYNLPCNFDSYSREGWICDPWANIVCPVRNYNHEWKIKMMTWSNHGKRLGNTYGEALDPGLDEITDSMVGAEKSIMDNFPEFPFLSLPADIRRAIELLP